MAYNSKYTGAQVEALLDKVNSLPAKADAVTIMSGAPASIGNVLLADRVMFCLSGFNESALTVSFDMPSLTDKDEMPEYMLQIKVETTVPTITWPSGVYWPDGNAVSLEAGFVYEFHIAGTAIGYFITYQKFATV